MNTALITQLMNLASTLYLFVIIFNAVSILNHPCCNNALRAFLLKLFDFDNDDAYYGIYYHVLWLMWLNNENFAGNFLVCLQGLKLQNAL